MCSCVLVCMLAWWAPFCSHEQFFFYCRLAITWMRCKVGKGFYSVPVNQKQLNCANEGTALYCGILVGLGNVCKGGFRVCIACLSKHGDPMFPQLY